MVAALCMRTWLYNYLSQEHQRGCVSFIIQLLKDVNGYFKNSLVVKSVCVRTNFTRSSFPQSTYINILEISFLNHDLSWRVSDKQHQDLLRCDCIKQRLFLSERH